MAPSSRSTRSRTTKASPAKNKKKAGSKRKAKELDDSDALDSESDAGSDFEAEGGKGKDVDDSDAGFDSDALDDSEDEPKKKRKRVTSPVKRSTRSTKKRKVSNGDDEEVKLEHDLDDGQEIVGIVVQAPTTGRVPPGQVSQNTMDFLANLRDPKCNEREWFKLHDPVFRLAENEWKAFVESFTELLTEIDNQVPPLPPKDVVNRIYRDVRFSNDKTPYKKSLSASFSRSGRKGIFAACGSRVGGFSTHLDIIQCSATLYSAIEAEGHSVIAAGAWCPGKNELATIRSNILRNSSRLRDIISAPEFVKYFGEPAPHPDKIRRSVFGQEDELKVAPKGIDKTHKDIDLLKCRSFGVEYRFTDEQVVEPGFKERLAAVARVMQPFVHCMNDMITLAPDDDDDSQAEDADGDEDS